MKTIGRYTVTFVTTLITWLLSSWVAYRLCRGSWTAAEFSANITTIAYMAWRAEQRARAASMPRGDGGKRYPEPAPPAPPQSRWR